MNTIVLLIGTNEAGKTKTLKEFFCVSHIKRLKPLQLLKRVSKVITIYSVSLSSPQEQSKFCNVPEVEARIKKRIGKCEEDSKGKEYILVIPFGIYQKNRRSEELNEKCILEPIEWLKSLGFKVISVYLKKEKTRLFPKKNLLVSKVTSLEIKSDKNYPRQAKELENVIKNI